MDDESTKTDEQALCMGCGLTYKAEPIRFGPFQMEAPSKCEECLKQEWFAKKHLVGAPYKPAGWRPKNHG